MYFSGRVVFNTNGGGLGEERLGRVGEEVESQGRWGRGWKVHLDTHMDTRRKTEIDTHMDMHFLSMKTK